MGTWTTPAQLAAAIRKRHNITSLKIAEVTRLMAQEGTQDLRDVTRGTLQEKDLRRMGHPYARRARTIRQIQAAKRGSSLGLREKGGRQVSRSGAVKVLPTNAWTGQVRRGIFMAKGARNSWDVGSKAPHAQFLFAPKGTKYMKPREVMGERSKHGQDGILRRRFRARAQGYLNAVRDTQRKAVP